MKCKNLKNFNMFNKAHKISFALIRLLFGHSQIKSCPVEIILTRG